MAPFQFPPDLEQQLQQWLGSGEYTSTEEVLREAFVALNDREEERIAIGQGLDDMHAGRTMPLREFDREFRQRKNLPPDA